MTLQELRNRVVKQTGRYDLVGTKTVNSEDVPDMSSDNGIDHYINQAVRWLDESVPIKTRMLGCASTLAIDEHTIVVPRLQQVEYVTATDADDALVILTPAEIDWILNKYDTTEIDSGTPAYWYRTVNNPSISSFEAILSGTMDAGVVGAGLLYDTMYDNTGAWYRESSWIPDGDEVYAATGSIGQKIAENVYFSSALLGTVHVAEGTITIEIGRLDSKSTFESALSFVLEEGVHDVNEIITVIGWNTIICTGDGFQGSVSLYAAGDDGLIGSENAGFIEIAPPVDEAYTITVFGYFYSKELITGAATNWWTRTHGALVVNVTHMLLEGSVLNSDSAVLVDRMVERVLRNTISADIAEEIAIQGTIRRG